MGERFVTYEEFGAWGDGQHDDMKAIQQAHAFANEQGLWVKAKKGGIYYIGRESLTAGLDKYRMDRCKIYN